MAGLDTELDRELANLRAQGLYRELRRLDCAPTTSISISGQRLLNFASNDYLGLANEPALKQAAHEAIERYGAGSGASRLICGSLGIHHELDEALADFKGTEAALSFSTGYAAAVGTICALLGKNDIIVLDKLVHASIVDAARLSGAKLRVFPHNDLNRLQEILKWAEAHNFASAAISPAPELRKKRLLVVTESVFSMDGDHAPLREIVSLKEQYGAWLMVDEAHATGLYGARRSGLSEATGVSGQIEIQMGTLGKALGASGGCICGSRKLIDYLINRARSFVFSTAPVPAAAGAAAAGVRFVQAAPGAERCRTLWERVRQVRSALGERAPATPSAVIPILVGSESSALNASQELRRLGIFVPAIRYPTVARGQARLRVTLSAAHTEPEVTVLARALEQLALSAHPPKPTP